MRSKSLKEMYREDSSKLEFKSVRHDHATFNSKQFTETVPFVFIIALVEQEPVGR